MLCLIVIKKSRRMKMPKQYKKGKSNRLTHKTSIWTLIHKGRFGYFVDMRTVKPLEKLRAGLKTNPNISNEIKVSEKVEETKVKVNNIDAVTTSEKVNVANLKLDVSQADDLCAYNQKRNEERRIELEKLRAEDQRKKDEYQKELERCKKGLGKQKSTYNERKYISWVNPFTPINQGRLGHSQVWTQIKPKRYYD